MGLCQGAPANKDDSERNKAINKTLMEERRKIDTEVKLLLLGAGESGKSTVAKQMKIIHLKGFTQEEKESYKSIIFGNAVNAMRALINAAKDLDIKIEAKDAASRLAPEGESDDFSGDLTPEIVGDVKALWEDAGIKEAFSRSAEFQLNDCAAYYFDNVEKISGADYVPDEQDILRSRAKTTGIIETEFSIDGSSFRMVDVGGQRSERKKWMHCFQDVTAVIFCVAMSEYDLKLYEDETTNRMEESLKLFKEICNNKWFVDTHMILFLNKKDLFEKKIQKTDLSVAFPEYKGGKDFEKASDFIKQKFVTCNENPKKNIYVHVTCATDTQNVRVVFEAVKDMILSAAIQDSGLGL